MIRSKMLPSIFASLLLQPLAPAHVSEGQQEKHDRGANEQDVEHVVLTVTGTGAGEHSSVSDPDSEFDEYGQVNPVLDLAEVRSPPFHP
jgi:hypothetical protein